MRFYTVRVTLCASYISFTFSAVTTMLGKMFFRHQEQNSLMADFVLYDFGYFYIQ